MLQEFDSPRGHHLLPLKQSQNKLFFNKTFDKIRKNYFSGIFMLRFAFSPIGDMHIGNLRLALFHSIVAKQRGEELIVRIDDRDKERNIEGKDQELLDILALFGLSYSHLLYQSQNVRFHSAMALQLLHDKKAFSCFCSNDWLERKCQEANAAKEEYRYDDACRSLPAELVIDNMNPFTVRITRPDKSILIKDNIQGDLIFEPKDMDSFVIMNHDKTPTDSFASAVDDMLADISVVILSQDCMEEAPKQEHIRSSLYYDKKIEYAHIAKIVNDEAWSIKSLLEQGFLPDAIINYLISMGNATPQGIFKLEDAMEWFSLDSLSKTLIAFDINELRDINKLHLRHLDAKELSRYVGFADEEIGELARLYLDEASTTKELKAKIKPIFAPRNIPQALMEQTQFIAKTIQNAPYFDKYDDFKSYISKETGIEEENFLQPLRLLLTNAQSGPDLAEVYKYIKNYLGEIIK